MISYSALHDWVRKNKSKSVICEYCKSKRPYDVANISGKYKKDVDDYEWLCRSCHMELDGRTERLVEANINRSIRDRNSKGQFI